MSEIYNLTKSIHSEIDRINKKNQITFVTDNENYNWLLDNHKQPRLCITDIDGTPVLVQEKENGSFCYDEAGSENWEYVCFAIQTPQIRYILNQLKDVLHEFPKPYWISADNLCQKWLDGLDPLFDREPETVLAELLEILKRLKV